MKKNNITKMAIAAAALMTAFPAATTYAQKSTGWGDFKLFLDPGHSATENRGLWGYSEAQKVFSVAQYIKGYLTEYTDMPAENLKLCRNNEVDIVGLEERSDMANAWGADFFYAFFVRAFDYIADSRHLLRCFRDQFYLTDCCNA